eukprot:COSAG02_NODE_13_length_57813_cov_14.298276_49_plen_60_part_00
MNSQLVPPELLALANEQLQTDHKSFANGPEQNSSTTVNHPKTAWRATQDGPRGWALSCL